MVARADSDAGGIHVRRAADGRQRAFARFHSGRCRGVLRPQLFLHRREGTAIIIFKTFGNICILQLFVHPCGEGRIRAAFFGFRRERFLIFIGEIVSEIVNRETARKPHGADRRRQRGRGNILHLILRCHGKSAFGFHGIRIPQVRLGLGIHHRCVHRSADRTAGAAGAAHHHAGHARQRRIAVDAGDGAADVVGSVYGNRAFRLGDFLNGAGLIIGDGALHEGGVATGVRLGGSGDVIQIHRPGDAGPHAAGALDGDISNGFRVLRRNRNLISCVISRGV